MKNPLAIVRVRHHCFTGCEKYDCKGERKKQPARWYRRHAANQSGDAKLNGNGGHGYIAVKEPKKGALWNGRKQHEKRLTPHQKAIGYSSFSLQTIRLCQIQELHLLDRVFDDR